MEQIEGKSILVRVCASVELPRVRVTGSQPYTIYDLHFFVVQELSRLKELYQQAEVQAAVDAALLQEEIIKREELERLQAELQQLLETERRAKEEEEKVRAKQEKLLEEEKKRMEEMERLRQEQERRLEDEMRMREDLEEQHKQKEKLLEEVSLI